MMAENVDGRTATNATDGRRRSTAQVLDKYGARRMSTAFTSSGVRADFPPVTLDNTLYDFLREELRHGETMESHCGFKPHSEPRFGESVPLSRKYLIHCTQVGQSDDLAHLNLEICSCLLNFFVGPMKIILVGCEGLTSDKLLYQQAMYRNAVNNFSVIEESQRPQVMCYSNKDDFWVNHDGSDVRFAFAMDLAERVPNVFDPELIYLLNSKRWLAEAMGKSKNLAAPNDRIIDTSIKCNIHTTKAQHWYNGGRGCPDCTQGIRDEVDRVSCILDERKLPYVLKLTQSLSSVGTNIVMTEDQRSEVINKIRRTLMAYLPRITRENAHLYTMSLVMSDLIPGRTMALNFFVRRDGSHIFSGACHQLSTGMTGRQNTAITYADQEKLEVKYDSTLTKMSKLLSDAGYFGQVGVDIMEDAETGTQYIIDANVRTALSMLLYQLKGHFTQHGHKMSMVYECIFMTVPREEFEENFAEEFEEARIIILGSARLGKKPIWGVGVVLAGADKRELDDLSDRILKLEVGSNVGPSD